MANSAMLKIRVPEALKEAVALAAKDNGLDMSSFIRLVLTRATKEYRLPNAVTQEAIQELDAGRGKSAGSVDEFWQDIFK